MGIAVEDPRLAGPLGSKSGRAGQSGPVNERIGETDVVDTPGVREHLVAAAVVIAVLAITALPYLLAYAWTPPDKRFMGILLNVPDTAQYLSWARESGHALLIENKLTPEAGDPVFFNLFWLGLGHVAAALGLGLPEALQLSRPLTGALYLGAIYWFVGLVTPIRLHRWVSFLVIAFGGGLGWVYVVLKQFTGTLAFPLDVYVMEANTFLTVMAFPHQAMAGGLLVLILGTATLAFERGSLRLANLAGLLALVLGLQHGYDLLIVYGVVGTTALVLVLRSRRWVRTLTLGAAVCGWSVPAALYLTYITRTSPIWRGVLAQYGNAGVYTPDPLHLLVLIGLPLVLVLAGSPALLPVLIGHRREGMLLHLARLSPRELLLGSWLIAGFVLLYIPTDFQIKMLAGWQVPVDIYATRALYVLVKPALGHLLAGVRWRSSALVGVLFVVAVLPANVYLYAWRLVDLRRNDYPYYLHRDEVAALHWLEATAAPGDVVLSSLSIGQYIPSTTGAKAFLAHWAQTLDFYDKRDAVARFYDAATPERDRVDLVRRYGVRFVFFGNPERTLGAYDPNRSPFLRRVFSGEHAAVYRVEDPH